MADLVDQYFAGSPDAAPKGDVVDQYFSGQAPDSGKVTPDLLSQARARAQQMSPGLYSQGANDLGALARGEQAHPILGAITNTAAQFERGAIGSLAPTAAGLEEAGALGAHAVGWQGGEGAMLRAAGRTNAYQPEQGSWAGGAGSFVGGMAQMATPGFAATNAMLGAGQNAEQAHAAGQISNTQEALDVLGTGAIAYGASKLGGAALAGKLLPAGLNTTARVGATALTEGAINEDVAATQQGLNKITGVDPNADPLDNALQNVTFGTLGGGISAGARELGAQHARMQSANGEPSAHPPTLPAQPDPMAEFGKQLGVETPLVTDVEGKPVPVPAGAAAETDAELKARQAAKETEPPSPDTRAPIGPEAEADQATLDRIREGMAKPDEMPQRRQGEGANPARDRALIQNALQDPNSFGRRAGDWDQLGTEGKTLLQKLREQQIDKEASMSPQEVAQERAKQYAAQPPQFQPIPPEEGKTAPGEIGTGSRPESKSNTLMALRDQQENPQSTLLQTLKGNQAAREEGTLNQPSDVAGRINPMNKAGAVNLEPLHTYAESTLRPAISKAVNTFTDAWKSVNTSLGTGEGLTGKQSETKLNILQNQGELDRHAAVVEKAFQPAREVMKQGNITTSNDAGKQFIDHAEATGQSLHPDPEVQGMLDLNRKFNEANIAEMKKLGMTEDIVDPHNPDAPPRPKLSGDWIGRLFVKDDTSPYWTSPGGGKKSLIGSQAFLRSRDYDTYTDSVEAAQSHGLKPLHDQVPDMMLAKNVEVARSISTRKLLRGEEDRTTMKWGEDGKPTPGDGLVALKDRSGSDQRDIAIRKQDYAKYAGKMNGPEGQRFIKELRANDEAKIIRPGDPVPDGFVKSGVKATGRLYADPLTAHMFDSMIDTAPPGSAVTYASNIAKTIAGIQYMMGTVHLGLIATGHNALLLGKAADNAVHGELGLAAKNIGRAIDPSFQFGRKVRAQLLNPEGVGPEDVAGRVAASNANVYPKSVLAAHNSWENAKTTWEKDPIKGMQQGVFALAGHVHDVMSNQVKLAKTQYQGALAETQAERGISQKEGRATQAQGRAVGDAALGFASSKPAFQNQTYRAVRDLLFSAGQYMEGPVRIVAGSTADALKNLAHVATGNFSKTEFTPRMQAILGGAISLAATNAMIQLASTTITTGKPIMPTGQDWLHARTGKKDANGNDERVMPPGLATNVLEFLSHPTTYAFNRLNPVIRGVTETIQNKDYRGKQVYGPGENPLIKGAEHVVGETAPRAIGGGSGSNAVEKGFSRYLGARFTNPSNSDAENFLRGVEQERKPGVSQESAAKSEAIGELSKAWKTDPSSFEPKWQEAKQKLDLTLEDRADVIKRANEPQGLMGIVKNKELDPETLMQGWDKMTDNERKSVYYTMRERVGDANIGHDLKQQYWAQLSKDREAIK